MKKQIYFLLFSLLFSFAVSKAQITLSIGNVTTIDSLVYVPIYITGADTNNPISAGASCISFDSTQLTYLNTRANIYEDTITSNVKMSDSSFLITGINSNSWGFYFPMSNRISFDFFPINFHLGAPPLAIATPINKGKKTKVFDLVFKYNCGGLAAITFDTNNYITEIYGPSSQNEPNGNKYNLTLENGSVSLGLPEQIAPDNNALAIPVNPEFAWRYVVGSINYKLQVSTDSSFASSEIDQTLKDTTYIPSTSLQTGANYFWRIGSVREGNKVIWSAVHKFTTSNTNSISEEQNKLQISDVLIYPNPALNYIQCQDISANASFAIYNENGDLINKGSISANSLIDIQNLKNGAYFIEFKESGKLKHGKFEIKR